MTSYTEHFGFNAVPFSKDIDDDKLWLPPSKQSLVSEARRVRPGAQARRRHR